MLSIILSTVIMANVQTEHITLPRFVVHPRSQTCVHGMSVKLICGTNMPFKNQEALWLFNDEPITTRTASRDIKALGTELLIKSFDAEQHTGSYCCVVSTPTGILRSHDAILDAVIDTGQQSSTIIVVEEINSLYGSLVVLSATLPSSLVSENNGRLVWITPRGKVSHDTDRLCVTPKHLYIKRIQPSDAGLYQHAFEYFDGRTLNSTVKYIVRVQKVKNAKLTESLQKQNAVEPLHAVLAVVSQSLTLECGAQTGETGQTIRWEKFGGNLVAARTYMDTEAGLLRIRNLTVQDRGTYICRIQRLGGGIPLMYKTLVEVEAPPRVEGLEQGEDVYVSSRSDVDLLCSVTGKPLPSILWYFNGQRINDSKPFTVEGQALSISPVTRREQGIYQCIAENIHGQASKTFLISVQLLNADFDRNPGKIDEAGQSILSINPRHNKSTGFTQWHHITYNDQAHIVDKSHQGSLPDMSFESDTSRLNKKDKTHVATKAVRKHLKGDISGSIKIAPMIISGPENSTALVGDTIVLTCVVEADGHLLIRWLHNGRQLSNSQTGPGRLDSTGATGSLRIYDARISDSGLYTCVVDTEFGSVRASGIVQVVNDIKDAEHSKILQSQLANDEDDSSFLTQQTAQSHTASKSGAGESHKQMKIHPRRQGPGGVILSNASTKDGEIKLVLTDITNLGQDEGIALKWDVLHGSNAVDYFRILYRTQHSADDTTDEYFILDESLSSNVRSYIVDSLKPAVTYNFKVEAVSKVGHYYASNGKDFALPSGHYEGGNGKLARTSTSNGSRKVRSLSPPVILEIWEIPNKDTKLDVALKWKMRSGQQIEGFRIHYRVLVNGHSLTGGKEPALGSEEIRVPVGQDRGSASSDATARIFTHLIKGLSYAKEYEFRICAYNKAQSSDLSNIVSIFKSSDGAESVIHIQDASLSGKQLSMMTAEHISAEQLASSFAGLDEKQRSTVNRLFDSRATGQHYLGTSTQPHQTMLLYTSLAIAIVSLLLLLFTATLVFMLRHFRRRQRRFRAIHHPYGESFCSFESKHPCLAATSKKPYSSNCTECCCENMSNSSVANKMMPHIFSLSRVPQNPLNSSNAPLFISGRPSNAPPIDGMPTSNSRDSPENCASGNSSANFYLHHRCSCCRAIVDSRLNRVGVPCLSHHMLVRPGMMTKANGLFDPESENDPARCCVSQNCCMDKQGGGELDNDPKTNEANDGSLEQRNHSPQRETHSEAENFYHTLADTPLPRLSSRSPDLIPSPPCCVRLGNGPCKGALVCQCCGQPAGPANN